MCWNAEVSINTFIFATAGTIIGNIAGVHDIYRSIFYMSIASMQLLEFFVWKYGLGKNNNALNSTLSAIGLSLILLQPVAAGMMIKEKQVRLAYLVAYAIWTCIYLYTSWPKSFNMSVAKNGHLMWEWFTPASIWLLVTWTSFIIVALYISRLHIIKFVASAVFVVLATCFSYWMFIRYGTWGSVYCSIINLLFIVVIGISFFKQYCGNL
jgi:hypothetical protein